MFMFCKTTASLYKVFNKLLQCWREIKYGSQIIMKLEGIIFQVHWKTWYEFEFSLWPPVLHLYCFCLPLLPGSILSWSRKLFFFKLTSHHFLSPQQQMESTCVKTVRTADKKAATSLREICRPQTETVCISQMEKNTTPSDWH